MKQLAYLALFKILFIQSVLSQWLPPLPCLAWEGDLRLGQGLNAKINGKINAPIGMNIIKDNQGDSPAFLQMIQ